MTLDPQKTSGALAAAALVNIIAWAATYFWHVRVPDTIATDVTMLLTIVLTHVRLFANPPSAG